MQVQDCKQLRKCIFLNSTGDVLKCQGTRFIQDKEHLESVLGQSQETWFECLTARQIQSRKFSSTKPKWSVVDSPASSPTVSQLIRGQLTVGASPAGLRHSSPAPYYEDSFRARRSLGTPQSDGWERPLLGLSPGPSPIAQNKSVLSHRSSSGVYSLGLDDSTLSWTNSLATPPRDGSEIESQDSETDSSSSKTKDTARALFSPGSRLDSTGDSVLPLDSTFEEDHSDLDGSQSDKSQSSVSQSNREGKQTKTRTFGTPDVKSLSSISVSQEVQSKADILKQSPTEIKHMENWKENFKKRLISRKESLMDISKTFKTKNKSSPSICNDSNVGKKIKMELDNKSPQMRFESTVRQSHIDPEEFSLSPTFSQKSSHSKTKSRKSPIVSRRERSSVDDVLSDFFDPPSASVGKRKPAPSRKRKSLETEENGIKDWTEVLYNSNASNVTVSTPEGTLQSILASDKKTRSSSCKKVRFSENVKKCTFIPEPDSVLVKGDGVDKISKKKRSRMKKVRSKDAVMQIENNNNEEMSRNKTTGIKKENAGEIGNKMESRNVKHDLGSDSVSETGAENGADTKTDKVLKLSESESRTTRKRIDSVPNKEIKVMPYAGNKGKDDVEQQKSARKGTDENYEEDLFSQVSPSALNEMCDVAEKLVNNSMDTRDTAKTLRDNKNNSAIPLRSSKAKRFFYPSVSQLVDSTSCKIFQYREDESKYVNRKVLLNSVKINDVVDKVSDKEVEKKEHGYKVKEGVDKEENEIKVQQSNTTTDMTLNNESKTETFKDSTSDLNHGEYDKIVESLTMKQFSPVSGFQSAAGQPVHIAQQALDRAIHLVQEESRGSENKIPLNSVHCSVQDVEQICSHAELKKTVRKKLLAGNQPSSENVLSFPIQDLLKDFRDNSHEFVTKPEIKDRLEGSTPCSDLDNLRTSFKGFQCASGKVLNTPSDAMAKAASIFQEDNLGTKTSSGFKSMEENNRADMVKGFSSAAGRNIDVSVRSIEKAATILHEDKLESQLPELLVNDQSWNVSGIGKNILKGFQSASGKELHIQDKALEKAASLLQEERYNPNSCSTICKEHVDVSEVKQRTMEYGFEDDFELSEWCDDGMETNEDILLCVEDVKTEIGDISEGLASSKVAKELKDVNISEDKKKECRKDLIEEISMDSDMIKEDTVSNALSVFDENVKLSKIAVDKDENLSDMLPLMENCENIKPQEIATDTSKLLIEGDCKGDCKGDVELKLQETNENMLVACDKSKQDNAFVGFHTASGESVALNAEKLKRAEKLLIDSNTDQVSSANIPVSLDDREEISGNVLPGNRLVLQQNAVSRVGLDKPNGNGVGNSNVGFSSTYSRSKQTLPRKSDFDKMKVAEVSSKKSSSPKQKLSRNTEKDSGRMTVAERLQAEFENEFKKSNMEHNPQSVEEELKDLENFKNKRGVQVHKEKLNPVCLGSKDFLPLKQCPTETNKPKGFRPFKPPKITKLTNHDKYPESKRKDWGSTIDSNIKGSESKTNVCKGTEGRIGMTEFSKIEVSDNPEMKINGLQTCESNQDISGKYHDRGMSVNDNRDKYESVAYTGSKEKPEDGHYHLPKVNNDTSFSNIICMSDRNFAETDSSNIVESNFDDDKSNDNTTVSISNVEFDGFSQMFDDEMDFTQMKSAEDSEIELKCSRFDDVEVDRKRVGNKTMVHINNEAKGERSEYDFTESDGRENEQKSQRDVKIESKKEFHNDSSESTYSGNKGFVGFSSASGRALPISTTAMRSAAKMLFDCDEGQTTKDTHTLGFSNDTDFLKHKVNGSDVFKSCSYVNIGNKIGNKVVEDKCSMLIDVNRNSEEMETAVSVGQMLNEEIKVDNPHKNIALNRSTDDNSLIDKKMKPTETVKEESISYFEERHGEVLENGKLSENTLEQKHVNPIPCFFQTASGKPVHISEAALKEANTSMNTIVEEHLENIIDDKKNNTRLNMSNKGNGNRFSETNMLDNGDKSKNSKEIHALCCKNKLESTCSFQTASEKAANISSESLSGVKEAVDEKDVEEANLIESCPQYLTASDDSVRIPTKSEIVVNEGFMSVKIRNVSDDHVVPECSNNDKRKGSSDLTSSGSLSVRNPVKENTSVLNECTENIVNVETIRKSNQMPAFCGYSSALGKKVEVAEGVLKNGIENSAIAYEDRIDSVKSDSLNDKPKPSVDVSKSDLLELPFSCTGESSAHMENTKTIPEPKLCGFSTASGREVAVSGEALKHAKETLFSADEQNEILDIGKKSPMHNHSEAITGFSTASGREVCGSKMAVKYDKETFVDTDKIDEKVTCVAKTAEDNIIQTTRGFITSASVPNFCGLSTASGQKVEVSETALGHAKVAFGNTDEVGEEFEDISEFHMDSYGQEPCRLQKSEVVQTHSNFSTVPEKEVEEYENNLKAAPTAPDIDPIQKKPDFVGFSTASGTRVQVSDEALKHAKRTLSIDEEVDNRESVLKFAGCSVPSQTKAPEPENTLNQVRTNIASDVATYRKDDILKFGCFRTASENVCVSESTVKQHRQHLEDSDKTEYKSGNIQGGFGFSTASGNKVCVSEKALRIAKEKLRESDRWSERTGGKPEIVPFSNDSGNKVCVSESANKKLEDFDKKVDIHYRSAELCGFSTAAGSKVSISESALQYTKKKLADSDSYSSGSGTKVQLPKKSLGYTKEQSSDDVDSDKDRIVLKFDGFSTASGNKVQVPEKALQYAKGQFTTDGGDETANVPKFDGLSTASGNKVHVSERALQYAKGQFTANGSDETANVPTFDGFSTASGNKVHVSEKALQYAKGQFTNNDGDESANVPKFDGFSTASGNKVHVSEKALQYAKGQFTTDGGDETANVPKFDGFSTASGNKVHVSEKALQYAKGQFTTDGGDETANVPKFDGFSTASGNKVQVSEKALQYAKGQFTTNGGDETANIPKFDGFSTASGNKVHVSEKALQYAKGQFTTDGGDETANIPKFDGFSTASGNKVQVSEKALQYANGHFADDVDSYTAKSVPKPLGFCTASGNTVEVTEEALKHARENMPEADGRNGQSDSHTKFVGFSTALGTKVNVSESALRHVIETFCDSKDSSNQINPYAISTGFETTSESKVSMTEIAVKKAKDKSDVTDGNIEESSALTGTFRPVSHLAHLSNVESETGRIDEDVEEVFGMALKRRKLDMNKERKLVQNLADEGQLCRRKSVRSTHEGVKTDNRHPGFRPFKPVFCKSVDGRGERQETKSVDVQHNSPAGPTFGVKSPFQTPYRHTHEKLHTVSDKKSPAKFGTVSTMGQGDGSDKGTLSRELNTLDMSPSGDCKKKAYPNITRGPEVRERLPSSIKALSLENDSIDKSLICAQEKAFYNDTKQKSSKKFQECTVKDSTSPQTSKLLPNICVAKKNISIDTKESLMTESSNGEKVSEAVSEFDSFSQDEDDVYYCTLVEARRHQDEIIKQRAANRVRPMAGRLWQMKQAENKWKLRDVVDRLGPELQRPVHVTSESAADHKFSMMSHYDKNTAHVMVGDGAYLVPDDAGRIGKEEFYRAFLTMEGVDGKLISDAWVYNHYRWIVWKLAAYENASTCLSTRSLTPEMVMLQLKYRYDREVDFSHRSAIKKIYERDDTPSKRLVLCVSAVKRSDVDGSAGDQSKPNLDQKVLLELTDGWYSIPTQIDGPLTQLVLNGTIRVGQKLCITGADLVGGEDACTPLEAPPSIMLRICRNSTRPARWDSILGYQSDPRPLCVPLSGLDGEGGVVGVVDVVIVRKYPTMYMEKLEGGGCMFRTSRCEDRARQEFESRKQIEMEKVYRQMENVAEKEEKLEKKSSGHKKFSRSDIENLQSGQDIYDATEEAAQPDMIQNYLSDVQVNMLYEYQRQVQEQKQFELNSKFQRAWQEKLEIFPERVVTPLLKFRVAGCANRDLDLKTSTILTVWRPAPEISDLQEGHRYKIYSLNTSVSRSKYTGHTVQLTATKQTRFRRMQLDENILDNIYEPREVLWSGDIRRRQPPFGELDFVGIIVKSTQSASNDRMCDTVYLADCQTGLLAVRFLNGYKSFGEDLFTVGRVLCCSNLMDKSPYRYHHIPTVDVSPEFTHITNSSQNAEQRKALAKLNTATKDKTSFMEKAVAMLENVSVDNRNQSIPKKILEITEDFLAEFPKRNVSTHQVNTGQSDVSSHPVNTGQSDIEHLEEIDLGNDSFETELENHKSGHDSKTIATDGTTSNSDSIAKPVKEADISELNQTPIVDSKTFTPAPGVVTTPVIERKRSIAQAKMARLMSYGSPSVLSPLRTTLPRSVSKGFKPPAFKKL